MYSRYPNTISESVDKYHSHMPFMPYLATVKARKPENVETTNLFEKAASSTEPMLKDSFFSLLQARSREFASAWKKNKHPKKIDPYLYVPQTDMRINNENLASTARIGVPMEIDPEMDPGPGGEQALAQDYLRSFKSLPKCCNQCKNPLMPPTDQDSINRYQPGHVNKIKKNWKALKTEVKLSYKRDRSNPCCSVC